VTLMETYRVIFNGSKKSRWKSAVRQNKGKSLICKKAGCRFPRGKAFFRMIAIERAFGSEAKQ